MSMLVRKGTMLHRNPSRRSTGRRSSRSSISGHRNKGDAAHGSSASPGPPDRDKELPQPHSSATRTSSESSTSSWKASENRKGSHPYYQEGPLHLNMSNLTQTSKLSPKSCDAGSSLPGDISRRTSSCTSQISGDDRRQLYRYSKFAYESRSDYGSILSQIREANTESTSSWEFTNKFYTILCRSAFATAFFVILTILPLSMTFTGIKYLNECPIQPNLPLYFLVGGFCALMELVWAIYTQIQSRKYEHCDSSFFEEDILLGSSTLKVMQWALSGFLIFWFALGNSWIWGLSESGPNGKGPPPFEASIRAPNVWCSEQLYLFSISHLYIVYGLLTIMIIFWAACFIITTLRNYHQAK